MTGGQSWTAPYTPHIAHDGVPMCSGTACPKYAERQRRCTVDDVGNPTAGCGVCSPAVRDMVLRLDAHEDASTPAFDEIVKLCGLAKTWEYPGQVVRDVEDAIKKAREEISAAKAEIDQRDQKIIHLEARRQHVEARTDEIIADRNRLADELAAARNCIIDLTHRLAPEQIQKRFDELNKELDARRAELGAQIVLQDRLREKLRVAEAVRDDARAASQRYLDEKRAVEAERDQLRSRLAAVDEIQRLTIQDWSKGRG